MMSEVSLANCISKRMRTQEGWVDMPEEMAYEYGERFRAFLLSKCRFRSKVYLAIKYETMISRRNFGLYERLVCDCDSKVVSYIAGQSYPDEIRELKNLIIKR